MDREQRLAEASAKAKRAEEQEDDALAAAEWRRYRLIEDVSRDPEDLLAEGVALSARAIELAAASQ